MTNLTEEVRQRVRQRGKNRCEYCLSHQDYIMGRLQIDHIQPVAKGGTDLEENLCLACELYILQLRIVNYQSIPSYF